MRMKEFNILDTAFNEEDYNYWKEDFTSEHGNGFCEDELLDLYWDMINVSIQDERANLNKNVDGIIVAFVDLGRWNGRFTGCKVFSGKISSIINLCGCDDGRFYADRYNVKSELLHHDGANYLTYRIAKDEDVAERIANLARNGSLTWDYFRRNTKSLTPAVSEVYGWTWGKVRKTA